MMNLPKHSLSGFKSAALGAMCLAVALAALPAKAETAPPTITVTGEAMVARAPDMASLSLGVTSQGETAAQALAENNKAMQAVMERLKAAGVLEKDIQTSGLSVSPNWSGYDSSSAGEPKISSFTASNMVTVKVTALEGLGAVLDTAVSDGANTLNGVNFNLIDPQPALNEARKAAVGDARAKAELLAEAAGVKLGSILSISEGGMTGAPVPSFRMAAEAASDVPVEKGEVTLSASVTIIWALEK